MNLQHETPAQQAARLSRKLDAEINAIGTLPSPRPLFAIGHDLVTMLESVDASDGEIDAELDAMLTGTLAEEGVKLDAYIDVIRIHEAKQAAARAEADRYSGYEDAAEAVVKRMKARLKLHLEQTGRKAIATATGRPIRIQTNGGKVPLVLAEWLTPDHLPPALCKEIIDTEAVRAALEAGEVVNGASLGDRGNHVRVG